MTAFKRLHRLRSFSDSFESLLRSSDSELSILIEQIERSAGDPDAADDIPDELNDAYSALIVVRSIAGDEGYAELLADVHAAYSDTERINELAQHFSPTEEERESRAIRDAETETMPIIVAGNISLDFRVSKTTEDEVKFVPLFIVRITFDEKISGSEAVTFQASPYALTRLRGDISAALELLDSSAQTIGSDCLYGVTARKYLP